MSAAVTAFVAAVVVVVVGLEPLKMVATVTADAAILYHRCAGEGAKYLMTALALALG